MRALITSVLLLFSAFPVWAGDPAPAETLNCQLSAFSLSGNPEIPLRAFHPQVLILAPEQTDIATTWHLAKVHLKPEYRPFYSVFALFPWLSLTPEEQEIYQDHVLLEKGQVSLRLERFPQSETRVAGLLIELYIEGGYYAAFLHRPSLDGPNFMIQSPIFQDDVLWGHLHLNCVSYGQRAAPIGKL